MALLLSKSLQHCQEQKIVIASKFNKFYTLYTKTKISSLKNLFYPILFLLGKNSVRYVVPRICVKASRVTIDPWCFTIEFMVVWFEKKIYSQDHVLTILLKYIPFWKLQFLFQSFYPKLTNVIYIRNWNLKILLISHLENIRLFIFRISLLPS